MTALILSALNILSTPPGEASGRDAACSQGAGLSAVLRANRSQLLEQLEQQSALEQVRRLRQQVMAEALWLSTATGDLVWEFVQEGLVLLLALARHLCAEVEVFERTSPSASTLQPPAEKVPPLSPDVLSVSQQKMLASALQLVVSLGLCPYLAPGVGLPLAQRSAFGAQVQELCCGSVQEPRRRLLTTTRVLLELAELPSLAAVVFTQHLNDLMAALCQLGYQRESGRGSQAEKSLELSAEERHACREALRGLLGNVYQPVVVQELLVLQNGPKQSRSGRTSSSAAPAATPGWLRRLCGQLLSERLMQPGGVHAVVRATVGQGAEEEPDWRRCEAVARILVTCPQQSASAESYYASLCPQILDLLHFRDKLRGRQYQRLAVRALHLLAEERPSLARQLLLLPLLSPLQRCVPASGGGHSQAAVEEWELSRCVDDVFKVCVLGNSRPESLLKALQEVLPIIFTLFCFTKQNVSHLRTSCQDILLWFLSHGGVGEALRVLQQLSGLQAPQQPAAASLCFRAGSEGGARPCSRESCSVPTADAEEDEVLFEKLSGEQWRLECLMELLAELKDSDLPGAFFLFLLQELTDWASCEEEENDEEQLAVASLTLEAAEDRPGSRAQRGRLALLQVLAVTVERLPHTVLLRKRTQVVEFLAALYQRACVGLDGASGPGLVNVIDSESLSMGMGLLATLLCEPQLSAEDYLPMLTLLPHLERLSQAHSVAAVRELAFSLRAVIATRGAYQPEDLKQKAPTQAEGSRKAPTQAEGSRKAPTQAEGSRKAPTQAEGSRKAPHAAASQMHPRAFSEVLLEAFDPDVPTRALALRELTQMVQSNTREAVQAQEEILRVFLKSLEHEDSFIYLSAIQGLAVMANRYPERILQRLLQEFQPASSRPSPDRAPSLEIRLKMGEVLMRASRAMGDLTPHLGHPLVGVFLQGTKDPDHSIRASSLSNLGVLCQRLDYSLGPLAQELSSCLTALIKTEQEAEVRRAAVHVITQLLQGLSDRTTQVLSEVLLDLYRALKWVVRSDPDEISVLHAQLALEELDHVARRFIFPEQKLQKKIVVLP